MNKKDDYNVVHGAKAYLGSLITIQILPIVLIAILSLFFKTADEMKNSLAYILCMMVVAQLAFFLVFFWINKKNSINYKSASKLKFKVNIKNILLCILISVVAIVGFVNFVSIFDIILEKIGYESTSGMLPNDNVGYLFINVILCALVPAIMEELIFRGIIFNGLRKRGFWTASLISSIMFMSIHLSPSSIVYPIIMGIIFCLIVEKTGSILYSMIVHFCNNFFVLLIEYISIQTGNNLFVISLNVWWKYALVIIFAVIAFLIITQVICKFFKINNETSYNIAKPQEEIKDTNEDVDFKSFVEKKQETKYIFGSLAVGLVFWLLMIILSIV